MVKAHTQHGLWGKCTSGLREGGTGMVDLEEQALWLTAGDDEHVLDDPDQKRLFAYWMRAAAGGSAPRRRDIDPPIDLPSFLPTTIMFNVERGDGGALSFRYRVLGTRLAEFAGRDLRGQTIEEAFGPEFAERDMAIYRQVVEDCVCYSGLRTSMIQSRQTFERYRRLVLPVLGDETGRVDMIWSWLNFIDLSDGSA